MKNKKKSDFERASDEQGSTGFFSELWGFMKHNKKWWLLPLLLTLLLLGLLILLSSTGLAPFIYTLF